MLVHAASYDAAFLFHQISILINRTPTCNFIVIILFINSITTKLTSIY